MIWGVRGGPWDLVTTHNWAYNPTYRSPMIGVTPIVTRVKIPVISSY